MLGQATRFVNALHTLQIRPTLLSDWSEIIAATPHWLTRAEKGALHMTYGRCLL